MKETAERKCAYFIDKIMYGKVLVVCFRFSVCSATVFCVMEPAFWSSRFWHELATIGKTSGELQKRPFLEHDTIQ